MRSGLIKILISCFLLSGMAACNQFTFTPRSKKNIRSETPSILVFERIVEFREKEMGWPVSKTDFMNKGIRYYEVMKDFPYQSIEFKIIDSNNMVFTFSDHIKDARNYAETNKIDLNAYQGSVRFYKENEKFLWKLKMK
jgi:hypothetical protein